MENVVEGTTREIAAQIAHTVNQLPELLQAPDRARKVIARLPLLASVPALPCAEHERLLQQYAFLASAYVHADPDQPARRLPASIAQPFVTLAQQVDRPPIFSYANFVLANWQRPTPKAELCADQLETLNTFTGRPDEKWFALIHVEVEAQAAQALRGASEAMASSESGDIDSTQKGLRCIADGLRGMVKTFRRMRSGCDPDVYYHQIRPYNFGFINVIFEGSAYGEAPQNLRGGSGAQSSVIPALVAALGIQHEATDLMVHLNAMQPYMPREHRAYIQRAGQSQIRAFVDQAQDASLTDVYNDCLRAVTGFRQLHMNYAKLYIFERGGAAGTGGTPFMDWLSKLIDETEAQYL
ncbi:MAG: hypothetical protein U0670_00915 [Anaerolineae bacterium]